MGGREFLEEVKWRDERRLGEFGVELIATRGDGVDKKEAVSGVG